MYDNNPQAPTVLHCGSKTTPNCDDSYHLPESLLKTIFNTLSGKCGNQLKLITVLMGVPGSGQYRLSQKQIMEMTGMDESGYKRARKALIDLGWISHKDGCIRVHFDQIRGESNKTSASNPAPPPDAPSAVRTTTSKRSQGMLDIEKYL